MKLTTIETPCLILEKGKLEKNILNMNRHIGNKGVNLRPHGKTAKNIDIVRMALEGLHGGITVSTIKEAEYFFENGITDILYAVGIAPVKLDRLSGLIKQGADITLILDSVEQAEIISGKGRELGVTFPALIEIDSDGHRAGVAPGDRLLIEIGNILHNEEGAELRGILTHAGESYNCSNPKEIEQMAIREKEAALQCAGMLRLANLPCPVVSIGSTPTAEMKTDLTGITEVRAGVYMFYDLVMAGLGVCPVEDIAVSVMASVIGYQKNKGWLITDSGWMALSSDRGTASQIKDQGYGLVCDRSGAPIGNLIVSGTNQEHGIITDRSGGSINYQQFPIGTVIRILPNHACATTAMHDRYYVVDGSDEVLDVWPRVNGW